MKPFNISRINTDKGIFRISGLYEPSNNFNEELVVNSIEVMGTDGWVMLNQSSSEVIQLINNLAPTLLNHLAGK